MPGSGTMVTSICYLDSENAGKQKNDPLYPRRYVVNTQFAENTEKWKKDFPVTKDD